jgi:peptide/nickel transport system substrate-binding protein
MKGIRLGLTALLVLLLLVSPVALTALAGAAPEGQMTWAVHISLAPTWFDPAETPGIATPFMVLYALHDALVKPMPGNPMAPSLAESWTVSKDALVYEFVVRQGARFHNGDPVTPDDVKFSFERYRGAAAKLLKEKVVARSSMRSTSASG